MQLIRHHSHKPNLIDQDDNISLSRRKYSFVYFNSPARLIARSYFFAELVKIAKDTHNALKVKGIAMNRDHSKGKNIKVS